MICPACRADVTWVRSCPQCGAALPDASERNLEIGPLLGRGTTSNVFEAVERDTRRRAALRIIHPWHASAPAVQMRFHEVGARLARLAHENVLRILGIGEGHGRLLVLTERADARRLDAVIEDGALPWSRVVGIVTQLCSALGAAHADGLVHGKLSSTKVWLSSRTLQVVGGDPYRDAPQLGDLVRVDLGCLPAGALGADASLRLAHGPQLRYQSPEQLSGRTLDGRSDLFALAVLAYELVTGQPPFPSRAPYAQRGPPAQRMHTGACELQVRTEKSASTPRTDGPRLTTMGHAR